MDINTFLKILKKRQGKVWLFILIFLVIASVASFSQSLKYQATSRLLIIQDGASSDPYTISKSNQYLSSLLSEAVYSGSFYDLMSTANSNIDWQYFNGDYKQQIKKWKKTISAKNINDTGVLEIKVYHPVPDQAKQIASAINNLLITQNNLYQGSNNNLKLKIIDQPLVSSFPAKPNLALNLGGALVFGLLFGLIYIYYFPASRKILKTKVPAPIKLKYEPEPEQTINELISRPNLMSGNEFESEQAHSFSGDMRNIIN